MRTKILFTEGALPFILEALGNSIDKNGFVVDKNNKFVQDADGKRFKAKKLIGIVNKTVYYNTITVVKLKQNASLVER